MSSSVFVHIVTWNSGNWIERCIASLAAQEKYKLGDNLIVAVTDNASKDETPEILKRLKIDSKIQQLNLESRNLGFAAGHNFGAKAFLESGADFFLILNPDVRLVSDALDQLCLHSYLGEDRIGGVCGKLLRADNNLNPFDPPVIDSTGIVFTASFRHFDRGAGEIDKGQYDKQGYVEGITGACLLITRKFVEAIGLRKKFDADVLRIYPELEAGINARYPLFDEAFFAYREDADLALRARNSGWKFLYRPVVVGYHVRNVTPERRHNLDKEINNMSVRNRFLLQINNFNLKYDCNKILFGIILRNITVILAVLIKEHSSIKGLTEVFLLLRRALMRR